MSINALNCLKNKLKKNYETNYYILQIYYHMQPHKTHISLQRKQESVWDGLHQAAAASSVVTLCKFKKTSELTSCSSRRMSDVDNLQWKLKKRDGGADGRWRSFKEASWPRDTVSQLWKQPPSVRTTAYQ